MYDDIRRYSSGEVAKRLAIEPVTVRKYSKLLEEQGYSFTRDKNNWRIYSDDNIHALNYLCNMKAMGKSLEESVHHVATLYHSNLSISPSDTSLQEPQEKLFQMLKEQQEFNKKILEQLETQERRQIERDQDLMKVLKEQEEAKKEIAAAEQTKWWQFWK